MTALNVLYQFDQNYMVPAGVSITTLLRNNQDIEDLTVYLAVKDVRQEDLDRLGVLSKEYGRPFVYLNTDSIYEELEKIGAGSWNGSLATWLKMFVLDEIPKSVDQLLYLDSDVLVRGSLKELADMDLEGYAAGAVIDSNVRYSRDRLKLKQPYVNAGVIYFNLKEFRKHDLQKKMLRHLEENIDRYPINDQDLLNDFFRGHILLLDPRYNFQMPHMLYSDQTYFSAYRWPEGGYYSEEALSEAREDKKIVHFLRFIGDYPWMEGNLHPCKQMFEDEVSESLWNDVYQPAVKKRNLLFRIERFLFRILPKRWFLEILMLKQRLER